MTWWFEGEMTDNELTEWHLPLNQTGWHRVVEETRQKVEAGDAAGLADSFNRLRDR
jgi:hypothetical protein